MWVVTGGTACAVSRHEWQQNIVCGLHQEHVIERFRRRNRQETIEEKLAGHGRMKATAKKVGVGLEFHIVGGVLRGVKNFRMANKARRLYADIPYFVAFSSMVWGLVYSCCACEWLESRCASDPDRVFPSAAFSLLHFRGRHAFGGRSGA